MPKTNTQQPDLAQGEYPAFNNASDGITTETVAARWLFVEAVGRVCPEILERLRQDVYPKFAKLAAKKREPWEEPVYWETGWRFDTWQKLSDIDNQLSPHLRRWARAFNADEDWVLEGALQTLWLWKKSPKLRKSLDINGFFPYLAASVVLSGAETEFRFEDSGWQPQLERWAHWRDGTRKRFEKELRKYKEKLCQLVEERGAERAYQLRDEQCFEWLALYQCKGQTLEEIRKQYRMAGDKTTIWHGIEKAAELAGIKLRPKAPRKSRKLNNL